MKPYVWTLPGYLAATGITLPKNLDVYLPGAGFLLVVALGLGLGTYRQLDLPARLCVFLLAISVLWLGNAPLVYWKKCVPVVPALIYLSVVIASRANQHASQPFARVAAFLVVMGLAVEAASLASSFRGMWRVVPFWQIPEATVRLLSIAGGVMLALVLLRKSGAARLVTVAVGGIFALTIVLGVIRLADYPRERGAAEIGEAITSITGGAAVVGDHNGFRFSGYAGRASFKFFQENDPAFPDGIFSTIRREAPPFVLVSDTYKPLSKTMLTQFGDYEQIAAYTYTHPRVSFGDVNNTQRLFLFCLRPEAPGSATP